MDFNDATGNINCIRSHAWHEHIEPAKQTKMKRCVGVDDGVHSSDVTSSTPKRRRTVGQPTFHRVSPSVFRSQSVQRKYRRMRGSPLSTAARRLFLDRCSTVPEDSTDAGTYSYSLLRVC